MRDLFQVVFELKKKEIEMTKRHIELHQNQYGGSVGLDQSAKVRLSKYSNYRGSYLHNG